MTSVVTGASGHVGANLVRMLLDQGEAVRAVVHRNRRPLEGLDVEFVKASVHDRRSLEKAFKGADTVYHLVSKISIVGDKDGSVHRTNVRGAGNAAAAARTAGVKRFVHMSSIHAFDLKHIDGAVTESSPRSTHKRSLAYDASKAAGEDEVRKQIKKGLDATILNPSGIIGPLDFQPSRMGKVFLDLKAGKMPALVNGGFDWVDVRDVCLAAIAASTKGGVGENHLIGGNYASVAELAAIASSVTGTKAPRLALPLWAAATGLPFAWLSDKIRGTEPTFTRESLAALRHGRPVDISKAKKVLGHQPRPLAKSIRDVYDWFEANP